MQLIVLMPCFDDALTASELVTEVHEKLVAQGHEVRFLLIDDRSAKPLADNVSKALPQTNASVSVLRLRKNMGHQRAIACGLCHVVDSLPDIDGIVVMDSDGEDLPSDVPGLVAPLTNREEEALTVFAERQRRSEQLAFRVGYRLYLAAHQILVGHAPRVGNFSAITMAVARGLVADSNLWSHYAATIWTSRYKRLLVPVNRGKRRRGKSKLSYGSLVLHGLAAISCYRETLAVRMLMGSGIMFSLTLALFLVICIALWDERTPAAGLAVLGSGLGVCLTLQLCILALWQCLNTLQRRHQATFMPMRDYSLFIDEVVDLRVTRMAPGAPDVLKEDPTLQPAHS